MPGLSSEPSAALGIAAILEDRDRFAGRHVVTIVCGSNVDLDLYRSWVGTDVSLIGLAVASCQYISAEQSCAAPSQSSDVRTSRFAT